MSISWTLLVRRSEDYRDDDGARRVRALLLPHREGRKVLAIDALKGIEKLAISDLFVEDSLRWAGMKIEPGIEPKPDRLEIVERKTPLAPFDVQGVDDDDRRTFEKILEDEIRYEPPGPDPKRPRRADGNDFAWALEHLYRSDRPLIELVRATEADEPVDGEPQKYSGALAGAASAGLVFEAELARGAPLDKTKIRLEYEAEGRAAEEAECGVDSDVDHDAVVVRSLRVEQLSRGFIFSFELTAEEQRAEQGAVYDGEHMVRVERWVGAAPSGTPDHQAEHFLAEPEAGEEVPTRLIALDPMQPEELVGRQLHYRVQVVNRHGRVTHTSAATVLRYRKDQPTPPASASARLELVPETFEPARLTFSLALPGFPDDAPENLALALFAEDRPLDACGFYGGVDDLALLNGLGALDLIGPAPASADRADGGPLGDLARERIQGEWGAMGLVPVAVMGLADWERLPELDPPDDPAGAVEDTGRSAVRVFAVDLDAKLAERLLAPPQRGRRFHVACVRVPPTDPRPRTALDAIGAAHADDPERIVGLPSGRTSPLVACAHAVSRREAEPEPIPVFQIERVPPKRPPEYLQTEEIGSRIQLEVSEEQPAGATVFIKLRHPEVDAGAWPVGGFRLWSRDRLGVADDAPFRALTTLQSVPPLVASYRPLALNGATPWMASGLVDEIEAGKPLPADSTGPQKMVRSWVDAAMKVDFRRETSPGAEPNEGARNPSQVFEWWFAGFNDRVEAARTQRDDGTLEPAKNWARDPGFAGTLLSVLTELGLAERLILPLDVVEAALAAEDGLTQALGRVPDLGAEGLVLGFQDAAKHPFATVALVHRSLPPGDVFAKEPDKREKLMVACKTFFGPPPAKVRILQLGKVDPETRAFAADRTFEYVWSGAEDNWRHEVEWAVEKIDRYHAVRLVLSAAGGDEQEAMLAEVAPAGRASAAIPEGRRVLTSIPRRREVEDALDVARDLATDAGRLTFRYTDPAERRAAARNALDATRSGVLEVVHELRRELVGQVHYKALVEHEPLRGWEEFDGDTRVLARFPLGDAPRTSAPQEVLDFGGKAPYYQHHLYARLVADGVDGPERSASGRTEPRQLGLPRPPDLAVLHDEGSFELVVVVRLARLCDALLDPRAEGAPAPEPPDDLVSTEVKGPRVQDLFPEALDGLASVPICRLPDLELGYRFHLNLGSKKKVRLHPLFELYGRGRRTGDAIDEAKFPGLCVKSLSGWIDAKKDVRIAGVQPERLQVRLRVRLEKPAQDSADWLELVRALEDLDREGDPQPWRFYFELLRQSRSTGPLAWKDGE